MIDLYSDDFFMMEAYKLASKAAGQNEIPVGAVVVAGNKIIGKGFNQTETLNDCTAHAEMIALTSAFQNLGAKYLHDCRIYITLEPCIMCAGALHWSQIDKVIYGASDSNKGYSKFQDKISEKILHPRTKVENGIMKEECGKLVEEFFKKLRKK